MVRADGIGDAVCLAPLISALRDAGHQLGALLSTANAQAFTAETFAHVHVVERIAWPAHGSTKESYEAALAQARAVRYDAALIASEEPEAYRFARSAGARTRIGFINGWEKPLKSFATWAGLTRAVVRSASPWRAREHEVETLFRLGLGLHDEVRPTRSLARLRPLVADPSSAGRDRRVAVQVAAKALEGGIAGLAAVVRAVAADYPAVVFGSPADAPAVQALAAAGGVEARTFDSVAEWREALGRMRAVVTPDSGAAHLAGMAGVPCVDLFPPSPHVLNDMIRWAPWAGPSRTLIVGPEPSGNARAVASALHELISNDG